MQSNGFMIAFATNSQGDAHEQDRHPQRTAGAPGRQSATGAAGSPAGEVLQRLAPAGREALPARPGARAGAGRGTDKSAEIVVYCASQTCRNSHIAATVLQ